MNMIFVNMLERDGAINTIEVPEDINLSLMEVLKASGYPVAATCGGMALCATCRVEVKKGLDLLPEAGDAELDMLDTLPDANARSRLACQIRLDSNLSEVIWELAAQS